jgi:hypothetical protein
MAEITDLTKDYFKKTELEKLQIQSQVLDEFLEIIDENKLQYELVDKQVDDLIKKAISKEDYEVAELFSKIKSQIKRYMESDEK